MKNQNLINKIDELLEVVKAEKRELKGPDISKTLLILEGELETFREEIDFALYKKQILDICKNEYRSKFESVIGGFDSDDYKEVIKSIVSYAEDIRKDGIKLSSGTIVSLFNLGVLIYLHGYTINDIDYIMGEMLGALLND